MEKWQDWDDDKLIGLCIYHHLRKINAHELAEKFIQECDNIPKDVAMDEALSEYWSNFVKNFAKRQERRSQNVCPETQRPGLQPSPDVAIQNGLPSIMLSQEEQMIRSLLPERMSQLAITREDYNTGTGFEQYEMESTDIGSSTSFNAASSYTDSGIEDQSDMSD